MTTIEVRQTAGGGSSAFEVTVRDGGGATQHHVSARAADLARLAPDTAPARLIEAAFRFLLDREPKESILRRFDLTDIGRYFPEFEREVGGYLNPR
ncbi:MAG: hypothetical protein KIS96_03090 [Bauldia sp.]|nr:hypothetical protein [Bauldia sp.]